LHVGLHVWPVVLPLHEAQLPWVSAAGAVQAFAVQVGFVDDVVPAGHDAVVAAPE
jgi:hypothetical protein